MIPNLTEVAPAVFEVQVPELCQIFFIFFFVFAPDNKCVSNFNEIWYTSSATYLLKPYISIKFGWYDSQ